MTIEKGNNQEILVGQDQAEDTVPARQEKTRGSRLLIYVSLILSILAVVAAAYNYRSINASSSESGLAEKLNQIELVNAQLNRTISSIQSQQQESGINISRLAGDQQRTTESLQILYDNQNRDESGWSVAEAEHLINIANIRITLEQDTSTALAALQAADNRLALLGDPGLVDIRRQLAAEINAIRSVTPVDITGLSLHLADIENRVNMLPLKPAVITNDTNAVTVIDQALPTWKKLLLNFWYEFRGMFTITRTGSNPSVTLLPDEKYFLYQNLRLQIEAARLAVLRHDTASLHESLQKIKSWLIEYFEINDNGVINILQTIESMRGLVLDPVLPNVSSSLEALRGYRSKRDFSSTVPGGDIQ